MLILGVSVLTWRAWQMQITQGEQAREQAAAMLNNIDILDARRGQILDRNGVLLANETPCYDLCFDYRLISENKRWRKKQIRKIARAEKISRKQAADIFDRRVRNTRKFANSLARKMSYNLKERVEKKIAKIKRIRKRVGKPIRDEFMFHPLLPGISKKQAFKIREFINRGETVGLKLTPSTKRLYPCKQIAAHIIGYVGPVYKEETDRYNISKEQANFTKRLRENYRTGDTIGKTGVEKMCENQLRPRRGYKILRKGEIIDPGIKPKAGQNIKLTIDIDLQERLTALLMSYSYSQINAKSGVHPFDGEPYRGSIVIIDVKTGDILAMVSTPTYNLQTTRENYDQLLETGVPAIERRYPLIHRAAGRKLPPASTVKPFVAVAGLSSNQLNPTELINCPGYTHRTRSGSKILKCWRYRLGGHGHINLRKAIKSSCNPYFAKISNRLGLDTLAMWFDKFGFGRSPLTGLPEETSGRVPDQAWLDENRPADARAPSAKWFMSVGQGYFSASPLQVANAYAALARGGDWMSANIVLGAKKIRKQNHIRDEYISMVHEAMHAVIHERGGTARAAFAKGQSLGIEFCGKTGTGQNRIPGIEGFAPNHAWFAGFGPYRNPEIAIAVIIENGGSGGKIAGPVAKEALLICQDLGYLSQGDNQ